MTEQVRIVPVGDTGALVEFGHRIDPDLNARVVALAAALGRSGLDGIAEIVPTYRSLLVQFEPEVMGFDALKAAIEARLQDGPAAAGERRQWVLPVVYGGAFGADLEAVGRHHGLAPEEVVRRHKAHSYRVYMIGFQPGFAYLGGLDETISLSRRPDPRPRVPAGSIMIGGIQAAISSVETPSGWHLLGRTPTRLFMPEREPAVLLRAGDAVRFEEIGEDRWPELEQAAAAGEPVARLEGLP